MVPQTTIGNIEPNIQQNHTHFKMCYPAEDMFDVHSHFVSTHVWFVVKVGYIPIVGSPNLQQVIFYSR